MDRVEQLHWLHVYTRLPNFAELNCTAVCWDTDGHRESCPLLASWAFTTDILVCGNHYHEAMIKVGCPVLFFECCSEECFLEDALQGVCPGCAY